MSTGRLGRLLETTPNSKSPTEVKGKNACDRRRATPAPSTTNAEHRYSSAGGLWVKTVVRHHRRSAEYLWWSVRLNCRSSKTYRNGHLLFNVPEEVDDDELEILLEEDGLYLGSYGHLVRVYSIVPITSLLVWVLLVVAPPLLWPSPLSTTPQALYFPTPLPELLFSISLFALSHQLNPYLFTIAGGLLFTPNGHKRARDGAPCRPATALPQSLSPRSTSSCAPRCCSRFPHAGTRRPGRDSDDPRAAVAACVVARARVLPRGGHRGRRAMVRDDGAVSQRACARERRARARCFFHFDVDATTGKNEQERERESAACCRRAVAGELSRGEDGGSATEVLGSPVRGRQQQRQPTDRLSYMTNDAEIQPEVDRRISARQLARNRSAFDGEENAVRVLWVLVEELAQECQCHIQSTARNEKARRIHAEETRFELYDRALYRGVE